MRVMGFVVTLVVMGLGRSRDRHQHSDCKYRRAKRNEHLLQGFSPERIR
jgi:hypothetical protein